MVFKLPFKNTLANVNDVMKKMLILISLPTRPDGDLLLLYKKDHICQLNLP